MTSPEPRLLVTGATGQLGTLAIDLLLKKQPGQGIAATVRSGSPSAQRLVEKGVATRTADYDDPASLDAAFQGIERLLFISSSAVGERVRQHRNVVDAAKRAGVKLVAYTSILHADNSPIGLAAEHRATEAMLSDSGLPHVVLRNGWYTENYLAAAPAAIAHGVLLGAAGDARVTTATRADYAEAAVAAVTGEQTSRVFELAGDEPYTLAELAAAIAKQSGKPVRYQNLSQTDYETALRNAGLPAPIAGLVAEADVCATKGALYDDSHDLSRLIGRPTTSLAQSVADALARA